MPKRLIFTHLAIILLLLILLIASCHRYEPTEISTLIPNFMVPSDSPTSPTPPSQSRLPTQTSTFLPTGTDTPTPTQTSTTTPTLKPGASKISPIDGMVLVYIPAGGFQMGSTETDVGADYDEMPRHLVTLDAYWMDQTVVTNAMFSAFLNAKGNQLDGRTTWLDAGDEDVLIFQGDEVWRPLRGYENHPAIEVTWYGAQAYCHWVGRRLPTEAEWENAAKGSYTDTGGDRIYPWGDEIDCDKAQYANCGGGLLPASSKPAGVSPYGVLGLSGNTWEWAADWYADDYYAISPAKNPLGPNEGETRTLRGGSWEYDWKHLRSANRRHNGPAVSMHDYGFRCVEGDIGR